MASLLELSHELLHCVFTEIEPADLASLSKTCRLLNSYVRGNRLLHKDLYIRRYDEPKEAIEPNWEDEVQNAVLMEKILRSEDREVKRSNLAFVAQEINRLLESARVDEEESANLQLLCDYFEDQNNVDTLLCSSSLFARGGNEMQRAAPTEDLQQASAKLHCLYGKPIDPVPSKRCSSSYALAPFFTLRHIDIASSPSSNTRQQVRGTPTHTVARSRVYDLREYTDNTLWGPFKNDGSHDVDWEKVEAIMLVLGFNLSKFHDRSDGRFPLIWDTPFDGATPQSYKSPLPTQPPSKDIDEELTAIRELEPSLDEQDPYGVSGTWMRVVCFLDYNDLYAFNFGTRIPDGQARDPIDTEEGIIYVEELVRILFKQIRS